MLSDQVRVSGFGIAPNVLKTKEIASLLEQIQDSRLPKSRAGIRHAMKHPFVGDLAKDARLLGLAREILGPAAIPFRATLFDKSPISNWLVVWHQDTALPLRERSDAPGWGPWSLKDGIIYAHAPAAALQQVIALRLHLDDSTGNNGPLRVLPGTHTLGVLSDEQLHDLSTKIPEVECLIPQGGVLAMRPLIVHTSSKSRSEAPRRVLHIEYASRIEIEYGRWLTEA
jgi:Phytanoyl-CoA dioxygenase (PhyH)